MAGEYLVHTAARPALDGIFLHGDQQVVLLGQLQDQFLVQGFDKAHVDDSGVQLLARLQAGCQQGTEGEYGDAAALAAHLRPAYGQRGHLLLHRHAGAGAARITHRRRLVQYEPGIQHLPAFVLVRRCHDHHVGQATQEREVVAAVVSRSVSADESGAVYGEQDRQLLHHHVVYDLVVGALQEGGVDGHDRLQALAGHAGGDGNAVLLGNGDVEILVRMFLLEAHQTGTFAHGGGDSYQAFVFLGHVADPVTEDLAEGGTGSLFRRLHPFLGIKWRDGMVLDRVLFGRAVTLALPGDDMQELRTLQFLDVAQGLQQGGQVMPVHGPYVIEPEFLEQGTGHDQAFEMFLGTARQFPHGRHL